MQRTNIYLEERQTEQLDRWATAAGISRAELIRRILDRALGASDERRERDLAAIDFAFSSGAVDVERPDREADARQRYLDRLWELDRR